MSIYGYAHRELSHVCSRAQSVTNLPRGRGKEQPRPQTSSPGPFGKIRNGGRNPDERPLRISGSLVIRGLRPLDPLPHLPRHPQGQPAPDSAATAGGGRAPRSRTAGEPTPGSRGRGRGVVGALDLVRNHCMSHRHPELPGRKARSTPRWALQSAPPRGWARTALCRCLPSGVSRLSRGWGASSLPRRTPWCLSLGTLSTEHRAPPASGSERTLKTRTSFSAGLLGTLRTSAVRPHLLSAVQQTRSLTYLFSSTGKLRIGRRGSGYREAQPTATPS